VNSEWVSSCWGVEFHKSVFKKPIICSGTILGTPRGFRELARAMGEEFDKSAKKRNCFARDQVPQSVCSCSCFGVLTRVVLLNKRGI
jgi:hypothetical protein